MSLVGSGVVGPGHSEYFDVVLQSGVLYQVYVQPTDPSVDFDLYVYDEGGNLVAQDNSYASDAYCNIIPRWTGPFRLLVKAARGVGYFNIAVGT
jgi:hypothetical protein